jgi:zinc/manganese transport system substrate-binding protein
MKLRSLIVSALGGALLAACAGVGPSPTAPGSAAPRVLATETFLGDMARNVAGDRIQVQTLLTPGVDPHEFEPAPQDAIKIEQAQVLIINGLGYESWLAKSLQDSSVKAAVVTATQGLTPRADPSGEHPEGDPHMWMSPLNAIHYVENIRDGLSTADPAGRSVYAANAAAYIAELESLDQWIKDQVAQVPPERRLLVTNHDALGYFAQEYDFKIIGAVIPAVTTEASPTAKQMADLIQTMKSSGAPAIFLDISENQKLADQIAAESGAKVVTDLYVETLSKGDGPAPTYVDMLKHDVIAIVRALK